MENNIRYVVSYFDEDGCGVCGTTDAPWEYYYDGKVEASLIAHKLINGGYTKVKVKKITTEDINFNGI